MPQQVEQDRSRKDPNQGTSTSTGRTHSDKGGAPAGRDGESRRGSGLSDADLVEGVKAGSEAHFNELYDRYFPRVYGFVHARMRSHSEAEEIAQEAFVSVLTSIDKYRGQASLISWIFGIAKNLSNNMIRRSSGQREKLSRIDPEHFVPQPSFGRGGPEEELGFQRYADSLRREIGSVSEWQVEIFEMRHLHDMSITEIARKTQRSSDAVRSSLYRIKKMMIEIAESEGGGLTTG